MGAPPSTGKGRGITFLREHVGYQGDDCLIWPMSRNRNGHGMTTRGNRRIELAHRIMCELVHGEPPEGHEAAHSCGRGHEGCVNPRHLSWKTRAENQRDRYVHNRVPSRVTKRKLTRADVARIREMVGKTTNTEIARQFGITRGTVRQIIKGEIWGPNTRYEREFTRNEILRIRRLRGVMTLEAVAKEYGVKIGVIGHIQAGRSYGWVS